MEAYERQYREVSAALASVQASAADRRASLEEAESLVRRMDLEARSLPPAHKAATLARLREYKAELTALKREAKRAAAEAAGVREELMEMGGA
eukprot:SM012354S25738  [mRNA]  locus=s12354:3:395:- [translate_table: standard]